MICEWVSEGRSRGQSAQEQLKICIIYMRASHRIEQMLVCQNKKRRKYRIEVFRTASEEAGARDFEH